MDKRIIKETVIDNAFIEQSEKTLIAQKIVLRGVSHSEQRVKNELEKSRPDLTEDDFISLLNWAVKTLEKMAEKIKQWFSIFFSQDKPLVAV
jgi:hypothetical protein